LRAVLDKFIREADGVWVCIEPAELPLPSGRVQVTVGTRFVRGARFMGADVAEFLEALTSGSEERR
jgi:hypothetical protein